MHYWCSFFRCHIFGSVFCFCLALISVNMNIMVLKPPRYIVTARLSVGSRWRIDQGRLSVHKFRDTSRKRGYPSTFSCISLGPF